MPDGTREPLHHGDEKASMETAVALNMALRPSGAVFDRIINQPKRPISKNPRIIAVLDEFREEWIPKRGWSESTQKEALYKIKKIQTTLEKQAYRRHRHL